MSTSISFIRFARIQDLFMQTTSLKAMLQPGSLPAADAMSLLTFPRFPDLPPEIRLMIWELLLPGPRLVEIDQNYAPDTEVTRGLIREGRPMLLSVCKESRNMTLRKYCSVFRPLEPPHFLWQYTGSLKSLDLRQILKRLGLVQKGTIITMLEVITNYMNAHLDEAAKFKDFGTYRNMGSDIVCPQWFNPKQDTLLLKAPQRFWRYNERLWCPWRYEASDIRHIAFELDRLIRVHPSHGRKRAWSNRILRRFSSTSRDIRFERLSKANLQSIVLVLKEDCEIIMIQMDNAGILKPKEWSYSLDLDSVEFKEQMGDSWTSVTWRVTLGKQDGVGLWDRAAAWNVDNKLWEQDKREICCNEKDGPKLLWHVTDRSARLVPVPGRKAKLLMNSDGKTYLGPSL